MFSTFNFKLMHTKTSYNYVDWPKNDQKNRQKTKKNIDRKICFHFLHFSSKNIYRFLLLLFVQEWLLSHFFMVLQRALADDVTNTSFSFHLLAGTFLNHHHVALNVLNIRFIITIQNSQFWRLQFTGIFVLTG